jgi:nucleoside-diphosphate-sugar epimerase
VARLVAAGHQVTGIARTDEKVALLESLGAQGVNVSLFDPDGLRAAIAGHDAVANLATKIPPLTQMARSSSWAENERIRREGCGTLVDAAIENHVSVFIQESLAFVYEDHGDQWIDATSATPISGFPSEATQIAEANVARFTAAGGRGVVLRFGRFYAPESDQIRAIVHAARNGINADVGDPAGYAPMIDADDAASAVVAALDAPAGVYDIVDDEPLPRAEQDAVMARAVGRRRLYRLPNFLVPKVSSYLVSSQRVSNRRFHEATTWRLSSPSMREGLPKLVRAMGIEPALRGWTRLMLWILAFSAFGVGAQAAFFPRSFYDDFPMGRGWVAMDGPYNEHLVRDVGALNLALLVVTVAALVLSTRALARTTAIAWLVYSVPHFVYHLRHLTMSMSGGDKVGIVVSLAITVVAPIVVLLTARRPASSGEAIPSGRVAQPVSG